MYLDLRNGKVAKNLIDRVSEGVFSILCDFSKVRIPVLTNKCGLCYNGSSCFVIIRCWLLVFKNTH